MLKIMSGGTCSNENLFDGSYADPPASITVDYPIAVDKAHGGVQKIPLYDSPSPPPPTSFAFVCHTNFGRVSSSPSHTSSAFADF